MREFYTKYSGLIQSEINLALQEQQEDIIKKIDGMGFIDRNEAGQFAMHTDGYNQAIEDIISLIKESNTK